MLERRLKKQEEKGLLRSLRVVENAIDFASNDYLGFSRSERLQQAMQQTFQTLPKLGSTGSRLLTGNSSFCEELEREIAEIHHAESALLFSSGYMANVGVITSLAKREDTILFDAQIHASMRDGITLSHAKNYAWRHNDLNHLEELLKKRQRALVLAESIYSTDGSQAPHELYLLTQRYGATLILDEAHALGIFPPSPADIRIYTFSKTLGVSGAVVLCTHLHRNLFINFARSFIYTTALPHYTLLAIQCAYKHLEEEKSERKKLHALMEYASKKSPIWTIPTPQARKKADEILKQGFHVNALLPPTVKEACLRITLHSFNTPQEFDRLCHHLS